MLRCVTLVLGIVWLASPCPADEKKVPLQTDFPKEVLAGTPPNVLMMLFPGLEAPADKPPELLVPEGTTNLARGKQVTSSETDPVLGSIDFVTDGIKDRRKLAMPTAAYVKRRDEIDYATYARYRGKLQMA